MTINVELPTWSIALTAGFFTLAVLCALVRVGVAFVTRRRHIKSVLKRTEMEPLHERIFELEQQNQTLRDETHRLLYRNIIMANELRCDGYAKTQIHRPSSPARSVSE